MKRFAIFLLCLLCSGAGRAQEWQKLVRGPFVVWVHLEDVPNAQRVLTMSQGALPAIRTHLDETPGEPVTVIIASSEEEFFTLTNGQIPEWGAAAADPVHGTVILKSPRFNSPDVKLERVLAHELAHVFLSRAAGGHSIDRWFDEGFAQVVSVEERFGDVLHLARSLATGQLIPLAAVEEVLTFQRSRATLAYRESRSAVAHLMETHGRGSIARVVRGLRTGDMDAAMIAGIGVDVEGFEREWVAALKQDYRWYVFLDFPVLLSMVMVGLFFAAFVLSRRRARKKRESWDFEAGDESEETNTT